MARVTYFNLTQAVPADHFGERSCYFRSSDVEHKCWRRLLWGVPDEMLFLIAKGVKIRVYDKSTKNKGKIETVFCPVLMDLLNYLWLGAAKGKLLRNFEPHFDHALKTINRDALLKDRFMFWKPFVKKKAEIFGVTEKIKMEKDYESLLS